MIQLCAEGGSRHSFNTKTSSGCFFLLKLSRTSITSPLYSSHIQIFALQLLAHAQLCEDILHLSLRALVVRELEREDLATYIFVKWGMRQAPSEMIPRT
jgi:hypothetical protein